MSEFIFITYLAHQTQNSPVVLASLIMLRSSLKRDLVASELYAMLSTRYGSKYLMHI